MIQAVHKILHHFADQKEVDIISQSGLFDADWYTSQYSWIDFTKIDPILHFTKEGVKLGFNPNSLFITRYYLQENPDVHNSGINPLVHYIRYGENEGRKPNWFFDPLYYRKQHNGSFSGNALKYFQVDGWSGQSDPSPIFDVAWYKTQAEPNNFRDPLSHYLFEGCLDGLGRTPSSHEDLRYSVEVARISGWILRSQLIDLEGNFLVDAGRFVIENLINKRVNRSITTSPLVSIIIPVYGQIDYAILAIQSLLWDVSQTPFEIIVIDDKSPDQECSEILNLIQSIKYVRNQNNLGFLNSCNEATQYCNGDIFIFLNSDTRVLPGWLDCMISTFSLRNNIGVVGSLLINEDLTIQESGGVLWNDGTAWNYGRNADLLDPRFNYAREADYVSGASLAIKSSLWRSLSGFDIVFTPAYYEDTDLCMRSKEAGYAVWVQPQAQVIHYEGATNGRSLESGIKKYQRINRDIFFKRWKNTLNKFAQNGINVEHEANRNRRPYILFIDALTPRPDEDSGSYMTVAIMNIFSQLGFDCIFIPMHDRRHRGKATKALESRGIQVVTAPTFSHDEQLLPFFKAAQCIFVFRAPVLTGIIDLIEANCSNIPLIFHTVDLHHIRERRQAEVLQNGSLFLKAFQSKFDEINFTLRADVTIVHTDVEKDILCKEISINKPERIIVFPYIKNVEKIIDTELNKKKSICFLGGFQHTPNVDAVEFLVNEIWPIIQDNIPDDFILEIFGSHPTTKVSALAGGRVYVRGYAESLAQVFSQCRVFVSPLRYGAGIKGKIVQALSFGVPNVATSIAAEGMQLKHDETALISDDPIAFASSVSTLVQDDELWQKISRQSIEFVERNYSVNKAKDICLEIIEQAASHNYFKRVRQIIAKEEDIFQKNGF